MRQFWANLFSFLFFCPDSDPKPLQVSKVGTAIGQQIGIVRGSGRKFDYMGTSTCTISTSTNFQKVVHMVVLVGNLISKFVQVKLSLCTNQLVRISHISIFSRSQKSC